MKKINANVKKNDRVVITTGPDQINFYYMEAGKADMQYLYTSTFSGSVFAYFRNGGKTLDELYRFNRWKNPKLAKVMERLPKAIAYVLKENEMEYVHTNKTLEAER